MQFKAVDVGLVHPKFGGIEQHRSNIWVSLIQNDRPVYPWHIYVICIRVPIGFLRIIGKRMAIRCIIHDKFKNEFYIPIMRFSHKLTEIIHRAVLFFYTKKILDPITVIAIWSISHNRRQDNCSKAVIFNGIEPFDNTRVVPTVIGIRIPYINIFISITVAIVKTVNYYMIKDIILYIGRFYFHWPCTK